MPARPARIPGAAPVPAIVRQRRRQQVVVRAPSAEARTVLRPPRPTSKTLAGLGPNERAFREEADTLPAPNSPLYELDETPPVSGVRLKVREPKPVSLQDAPPRPRPVTLIDGVHDGLSQSLLEEVKRLLASGIFDSRSED
ncbi:MAG TPA: hypothetical protein VHC69_31460 [Polyangiaceae bacterium]|nr:hypothetical protein [Polyangiaceae bacterium]